MLRLADPVTEMVSPPPRSRIPSATAKRPNASATAINASPATRASAKRPCIAAFYTRIKKRVRRPRYSKRQPSPSVHLHRPVDHVVQHPRRVELHHRDLDPRLVSLVDLVGGVEGHEAAGLDLRRRVGDPVLDGLLFRERAAERLALQCVGA